MDLKLKELRKSKNLTQRELAKVLNLTQSTIASYENGQKLPTIENLLAIAKYFNVSTDFLLGFNKYEKPANNVSSENIKEDSNFRYNTLSKEYSKLISYFERLENENQEYIIGKMIELYKEQINFKRYMQNNSAEPNQQQTSDDEIDRELESYRQELLSNKASDKNISSSNKYKNVQ